MMKFDFNNYTFSGLIALFAAILGIGYPLYLESIRKIDDQYDSTRLSARFQMESDFKWYRRVLLVNVAFSFCAPFLMLLFSADIANGFILTSQAIALLWLVFMMFSVFRVVQIYYDPIKILERLGNVSSCKNSSSDIKLNDIDKKCLIDLMRYSSRRNNIDVYKKCRSILFHLVNQEKIKIEKEKDYNVSQEIDDVFRLIATYSKDKSVSFFYNDNIASQVFYDFLLLKGNDIGDKTYDLLWYSVNIVAENGSDEWFRQHWSCAVQYYSFHYGLRPHAQGECKSECIFKEYHFMFGVLAMLYKRFDWLNIVLFYTRTSPASYPLTPGTFITIIDMVKQLDKQKDYPWHLTRKYRMKGMFAEVDSDKMLLNEIYRYAALLIIRLFSVNEDFITYNERTQLPIANQRMSLNEVREELKLVDNLKWSVREWYAGSELKSIRLAMLPEQTKVEELLDNYKSEIEKIKRCNLDNPVLDTDKMTELKKRLQEADEFMLPSISFLTDEGNSGNQITISVDAQLDNEVFAVGGYCGLSNFPDIFLSYLNDKLDYYYDGLFSLIPTDRFTINEKNVFKALSLANLTENHTIVDMGVDLCGLDRIYNGQPLIIYKEGRKYYNKTEIIPRSTRQSCIIIIERKMIPKIKFLPPSDEMKKDSLVELGTKTHLCSNLDQIISEGKTSPIVKIARNISSHIPEESKCIWLVINVNVDDAAELKRLKSL